jgi:hypothetical protein
MDIVSIHILLGIGLFFIINWIGKHSYSIGYMEISIFVKVEEAPALNFLIRVLTPIVYIIISSAILYALDLDKYVRNIFLVNIYYIVFRLLFNLITNRGLLLNWYRQFLYWSTIAVVSYFTYEKLIKVKANILPDFTTLSNELWIIILLFIFQVTNNIRLSQDGTLTRKQNYLKSRYKYFKYRYGALIKDLAKKEALEPIVYAILIYEDFNRPKVVRIVENLKQLLTGKPHTLGVMQVKSDKIISDLESVRLGTEKVANAYNQYLDKLIADSREIYEYSIQYEIIQNYNGGSAYQSEIVELISIIQENFYQEMTDSLIPIQNLTVGF